MRWKRKHARDITDFKPSRNTPGGSKKGRSIKKMNYRLRQFLHRWVLEHVGNFDEDIFTGRQTAKCGHRWVTRNFIPCIEIMEQVFGEEFLDWRNGNSIEQTANRLLHRHHKMYYVNADSVRAISPEHPDNRTSKRDREDIAAGNLLYDQWRSTCPR